MAQPAPGAARVSPISTVRCASSASTHWWEYCRRRRRRWSLPTLAQLTARRPCRLRTAGLSATRRWQAPGGGGIANAAGVGFTATLTLRNSLIAQNLGNTRSAIPAAGAGGGIFNGAILTATGGTAYVDMKGVIVDRQRGDQRRRHCQRHPGQPLHDPARRHRRQRHRQQQHIGADCDRWRAMAAAS